VLNIKYMVSDHALCCIPTLITDSNTSTGMIRVTLNMPSAAEEGREPSGKCQGISHCLDSGHPVLNLGVRGRMHDAVLS